jgi:hypothetical protein
MCRQDAPLTLTLPPEGGGYPVALAESAASAFAYTPSPFRGEGWSEGKSISFTHIPPPECFFRQAQPRDNQA